MTPASLPLRTASAIAFAPRPKAVYLARCARPVLFHNHARALNNGPPSPPNHRKVNLSLSPSEEKSALARKFGRRFGPMLFGAGKDRIGSALYEEKDDHRFTTDLSYCTDLSQPLHARLWDSKPLCAGGLVAQRSANTVLNDAIAAATSDRRYHSVDPGGDAAVLRQTGGAFR